MSSKAKKAVSSGSKSEKKPSKASLKAAEPAQSAELQAAVVDQDEIEEREDAAAATASSGGESAAALAAATGSADTSASFKNFRHHPDMENFYRFIYENDLRHEALSIVDQIIVEKQARRLVKAAKAHAH